MRTPLIRHPDSPCAEVLGIEVDLARTKAGVVTFRYSVTGAIPAIQIAELSNPSRADQLWRHTCFEAFILLKDGAYYEFNFAPSAQWAAYRFQRYRSGRSDIVQVREAPIGTIQSQTRFDLKALVDLGGVSDLDRDAPWRLAVTAIIENNNANKSFWSIAHAPGKPDFHLLDGFVLDLPVTEQT
jgi:hypothetical protein